MCNSDVKLFFGREVKLVGLQHINHKDFSIFSYVDLSGEVKDDLDARDVSCKLAWIFCQVLSTFAIALL